MFLLQVDLNKSNDEMLKRKQGSKEQERLIDLKVLEFQRAKAVCSLLRL